jgi:hypothetical protein
MLGNDSLIIVLPTIMLGESLDHGIEVGELGLSGFNRFLLSENCWPKVGLPLLDINLKELGSFWQWDLHHFLCLRKYQSR